VDKTPFVIWWLSQADCEAIGDNVDEMSWPDYIKKEYRSRLRRAGRGRLWVPTEIPIKEIEWDATKPLADRAAECGGIVIQAEDARTIATLPGFITDLGLNSWQLP
jgi:hypothetical protein